MYVVIIKPHESKPAMKVAERAIGPFEDRADVQHFTMFLDPESYLVVNELSELPLADPISKFKATELGRIQRKLKANANVAVEKARC